MHDNMAEICAILICVCSILAQVSATIVKPRDDRPYEGFLLINSEIGPMASSVYENGRYASMHGSKGVYADLFLVDPVTMRS